MKDDRWELYSQDEVSIFQSHTCSKPSLFHSFRLKMILISVMWIWMTGIKMSCEIFRKLLGRVCAAVCNPVHNQMDIPVAFLWRNSM